MAAPEVLLIQIALRFIGAFVCSNKAQSLNRNSAGWGVFGFAMPIIAMIIVHFMKPVVDWEEDSP